MVQKKSSPVLKIIAIPLIVVILLIAIIAMISGGSHRTTQVQMGQKANSDVATGDTPVETLKTLTAEMNKVENQNRQLIAQNVALKQKDQQSISKWKNELLAKVNSEITTGMDASSAAAQSQVRTAMARIKGESATMPVDGRGGMFHHFVWVADISASSVSAPAKGKSMLSGVSSLLNPGTDINSNTNKQKKKPQPIPYYTIPQNTILTGATALQPIIGRTPHDGKVTDPYSFSLVFGPRSIAANNAEIPQVIHGIIASGTATGDAMGSCVRGRISSMTFIFPDGRISTINAKDGNALGTIAGRDGTPCIHGVFHTNAAKVFLGTGLFAGLQGYGAGISQAETSSITSLDTKTNVSTITGNANKYALGQGVSSMGQEMLEWWNNRMKNYFDFVYVPNYDRRTGGPLKLNIKVTKELDIDYNPNGRKVYYEHSKNPFANTRLD